MKINPIYTFFLVILVAAIIFFMVNDNDKTANEISEIDEMKKVNEANLRYPIEKRQEIISEKKKRHSPALKIVEPQGYLNADQITIEGLVGKNVILVNFWTFGCVNSQRTLPYFNDLYNKYHDKGLEIIGVHAPEFDYEKDRGNVDNALKRYDIEYPVVMDNEFRTWNVYQNRYWPTRYLIDIDGFIVYKHIGEGNYEQTEEFIQKALIERNKALEPVEN